MRRFKWFIMANSILLFLVVVFFIVSSIRFFSYIHTPASNSKKRVFVYVGKGEPLKLIIESLKNKGIIRRADWFYYYVRLTGEARHIKAGVHMFMMDYTPKKVLLELLNTNPYGVMVTIPPGFTIKQIALLLKRSGFSGKDFIRAAHDRGFIRELTGLSTSSMEGFLYPDTYSFPRDSTPRQIIDVMFDQFKKEWKRVNHSLLIGYSGYKKLIIASIVEKECKDKKQYPMVASVIYNRLKRGMMLQMDSTVIYGMRGGETITEAALRDKDNPYNTYVHRGLPPTPICNPDYDALYAAFHPARTDFLYFVSKHNGELVFSKTLEQHNRNVRRLLK